ncbi:hypothetical protein HOY34_05180 [Xinfangfangia sp. D13-10-4-6]|uniref:hypothetical protein n=1 Tax=Pseudogemmobacter hezensis TaxID=2737662 RepID=UPI0015525A89|nr:hypothetical protein [Pseudogemmobacter hezensis]NPD14594.1 hypothetical protein [Pseudogemmobacter hezensis]
MPRLIKSRLNAILPLILASVASPALADEKLCLTGDFDAFLARFSHEIIFQEGATADPLVVDVIDPTAEAEPYYTRSTEPLSEVLWPVMPNTSRLEGQGLEMQISDHEGGKAVVLRGTDNGERTTWYFKETPCWTLVGIFDESM